jgi:UMF1 family MFS transporter
VTAQQKAWVLVDVGNSAFAATILAAVFPVYFPSLLPKEGISAVFFESSFHFDALTIWSYGVSASIFMTVLLSPLLGAWADRAGWRKNLFAIFTLIGVFGTLGLFFADDWISALISFLVANIGFCASNVFYNSLLSSVADEADWNGLSMKGFAWGYLGGGILLAINLLMIQKFQWLGFEGKIDALKWAFFSVAVWWLIFSVPAYVLITEKDSGGTRGDGVSIPSWFRQVFSTIQDLLNRKSLLLFIVSYAFFNEGIQTVITMASIYGKEAIGLSEDILVATLLLIQLLGLPFTLGMSGLVTRFGEREVLTGVLTLWIGIVSYAYVLQTGVQFLILGILVAGVLGVSQSLPRSIFQTMIPKGRDAEYFSFFALSGKMTSFLGPFVFGVVHQWSGNPRLSILALSCFFIVGLVVFRLVPRSQPR